VSQTKYIEYQGRGFWAYDVSLAIFVKHLIEVAGRRTAVPGNEWLKKAISSWRIAAAVPDYGLEIDAEWSDEEISIFTELGEQTCKALTDRKRIAAGEIKAWKILEDVRIDTRGAAYVDTAPVVELGRAIVALVNGSLPSAPDGRTWIYGAPEGLTTI
jgi:hypothetical protein